MRSRINAKRMAIAGICIGGIVLTGSAGFAATNAPWPQTDAGAAHSRYNATDTSISTTTVANVGYLRSITSPPPDAGNPNDFGCGDGIATAPVLSGGNVYAVAQNRLTAWSASTGARLWQTPILDTFGTTDYDSIAVASGHVLLVGSDCTTEDPGGAVTSYNASTGAQQWTATIPGKAVFQVVVSNGLVVIAGSTSTNGGGVSVRNLSTGAAIWTRTDICQFFDNPALVVEGRVIYDQCNATTGIEALVGVTLATGVNSWTKPGSWQPVIGDSDVSTGAHHLYVTTGLNTVDINPATGATRYTITGVSPYAAVPIAVDATRVYVSCSAGLCVYNRATGAAMWTTSGRGPIAVANGIVYTVDGRALQASNGHLLATLWSDGRFLSVGDGRIAVVADARIIDLYGLSGN